MFHVFGHEQCEGGGHADAVVGAQRRAVCLHPFAVDVDRVVQKVERHVGVLLAHHIHVALEHDGGFALHGGGGRLVHHDVADGVLSVVDAALAGELLQIGDDLFLFFRRTGDLGDLVEDLPYDLRFEFADL